MESVFQITLWLILNSANFTISTTKTNSVKKKNPAHLQLILSAFFMARYKFYVLYFKRAIKSAIIGTVRFIEFLILFYGPTLMTEL